MRLATLLTIPFLLASVTAQGSSGFSDEQRAELRKIIREEIRAAVRDLHGTATAVKPVVALRAPKAVAHVAPRVVAIEEIGEVVELEETGEPQRIHSFEWTTVAPDVIVQQNKKAPKLHAEIEVVECPALEQLENIEIHLNEVKPIEIQMLLKKAEAAQPKKAKKNKDKTHRIRLFSSDGEHYEVIDLNEGATDLRKATIELRKLESELKKAQTDLEREVEVRVNREVNLEKSLLDLSRVIDRTKEGETFEVEVEVKAEPAKKSKKAPVIRRVRRLR